MLWSNSRGTKVAPYRFDVQMMPCRRARRTCLWGRERDWRTRGRIHILAEHINLSLDWSPNVSMDKCCKDANTARLGR
jgi:hypothetical protein